MVVGFSLIAAGLLTACSNGEGLNFVAGDSATVFGGPVATYARLSSNAVRQVGFTLPLACVTGAPTSRQAHGEGTGPAGAWASLAFPEHARHQAFVDHLEVHWNPHGHPPQVFSPPHFDLHFYAIPEAEVRAITPADTVLPAANRVPPGYSSAGSVQEYQAQVVPQMGFHSLLLSDLGRPFDATMVLGYYGGSLIFIEPMITAEHLLHRRSFSMTVPQPQVVGRNTLYPTRFVANYDAGSDSYQMFLDSFVPVN